ncbi:MAG: hypothetical protein AB9866_05825 [Syntrophobacteraceae bacterium]
MYNKLISLSIFVIVFALVFSLGITNQAQAGSYSGMSYQDQDRMDKYSRDYDRGPSAFDRTPNAHQWENTNRFGDDVALNSVFGSNRDADYRAYNATPYSYGLSGNYGYFQGGP